MDGQPRNPAWPNVYSLGVCVAIPPVETTPVPTGAPKTGFMIESMVTAVACNIQADMAGNAATVEATWNAICLADMGDTGVAFVRSEEHTSELQSLMRISYAVFCLKKKNKQTSHARPTLESRIQTTV